jgi:hypothetical protein
MNTDDQPSELELRIMQICWARAYEAALADGEAQARETAGREWRDYLPDLLEELLCGD